MDDREERICYYFSLGYSNSDILASLENIHNCHLGVRQLRRILARNHLYRRKEYSNLNTVTEFIERDVKSSGQLLGYRLMHLKCIQSGLNVNRETVRQLLLVLDPEGVELRRRRRFVRRRYNGKGPNFAWHIDGYDKLKPYGIAINGCIDGFSRYIIWLQAYTTNNDPKVIASYYIESIENIQGCPTRVRSDQGTENVYVAQMQQFLRDDHDDEFAGPNSFLCGKSIANQRIESWWSSFRKQTAEFWISLFQELQGNGHFTGDALDKEMIRFCFMKMIQDELDTTVKLWNLHHIRKPKNVHVITYGRPSLMYTIPEQYNTRNYIKPVDNLKLQLCREECRFKSDYPCDQDMFDLCCMILEENEWELPDIPLEMAEMYIRLRNIVRTYM